MISNGLILAAAEGANPLIPNPWEILVVVVGFALLMFIVIKFIVPTLEKSYQDRVEAIEGGLEAAVEAALAGKSSVFVHKLFGPISLVLKAIPAPIMSKLNF